MTYEWILYACLFLAVWSLVISGVFSAFSEFIMAALLRSAPAAGMEAMQQINITVIRTQFVAGILLITPLSLGLAVYASQTASGLSGALLWLAPFVYLTSVFLMTLIGNVPMNNRLARLDANTTEAAAYWRIYGSRWTRLNHVRTLGSLATGLIYLAASIALIGSGQV